MNRYLNWRNRSLLRGGVLVLVSLGISILLSGFPQSRKNAWITLFAFAAMAGLVDHLRCMRTRWSWYHGGVILLVYMDLMALCMILFLLLYPYTNWITAQ
jgi:hypothetical protein